ncbi:RNA-guided endonuclease InsQ/TnpB family protein [Synechococcus sp. JA-2-3B'a(2-13)]|uniref:RNA-guided endonuclease InsQ/TnpB family protein n=1 Tax=Synechococcus sp. (strain JA-2-3B'a(2-13)) TaxID=321332 RepID=UPI000069537A|nr:RNA-guided endonuclease TnpB family protein [Synechococcus sp. JA-2-3B'a(2-13)]ABD03632.1 ISSoc1, transposase [Synechococcus sp. JA-2-3B'a(2-13)]
MSQVLTISCKLKVSQSQAAKLDATMDAFVQALNWVNQNTPEKIVNAVKLQSLCYYEIRARFGLSSNLAQQVCRRVAGARKVARQRNRPVKEFKRRFVTYDARIFSFRQKDWTVSLTTVEGRERFELAIGNYQRGMLAGSNPKSATLVKRKDGSYYIQICVEKKPPKQQDTDKVIGVDLGRTDIAHTSEGDNWNGQQLNKVRDHYSRLRAVLQRKASKGTRSSRRRCRELLQRLSGKERRFQSRQRCVAKTWVNHRISKAIVSRAKATNSAIALEDLTGIRERVNQQPRSKTERRRANSWAFYQLRQFLEYKARVAGVSLILVPPAYTSQTCHRCLHIHPDPAQSYRSGKSFKCGHCGWEGDADLNGANVIALLGAAVNQPRGSGLFCSLVEQSRLRATESPLRTA